METTIKVPRKIFSVIIRNKEYDVYDIERKEHQGYGDIPKTWWLYYSDRLPEGTIPPPDSDSFVPYHKWIERRLWELKFKMYNTSKNKWDEWTFSHGCSCEIWCNNKHIYSFNTGDINFAMSKAQYLMVHMSEHPFDFFNQEKENGRKIWWHGLPATIKLGYEPGEIKIYPDYSTGITPDQWWKELKNRESKIGTYKKDDDWDEIEKENMADNIQSGYINWGDALSDNHIDWFRK